jgi:predicted membrane GTPase involved in stress response
MFHAQSFSVKNSDYAGAEENHIACRQELSMLIQEQHADIGLRVCNFVHAFSTRTGSTTVHRSGMLRP